MYLYPFPFQRRYDSYIWPILTFKIVFIYSLFAARKNSKQLFWILPKGYLGSVSWPALTELPINEAPELPARNIPGGKVNRGESGCLKTHVSTLFRTLIPLWLKGKKGRANSKRVFTIPTVLKNVAVTYALQALKQAGKIVHLSAEQRIGYRKAHRDRTGTGRQGCSPLSVKVKQSWAGLVCFLSSTCQW